MSYRFMRTLLFFDLPTITSTNRKNYRKFVKLLKVNGFYRIQESVFVKMSIDKQNLDSTIKKIREDIPPEGCVMTINVTEKQYASMNILLGETHTDVITTDERIVKL